VEHIELVDTHCHLAMDVFQDDLEQVLERARRAGVTKILVPGIDIESSRLAIQLTERYSEIYAAVGVHPHSASTWEPASADILRVFVQNPKVVAIGEIGLDFYRNLSPRAVQIDCFKEQLSLASDVDLPIVVHNRESIEVLMKMLKTWCKSLGEARATKPGVLHAFSAGTKFAQEALELGFYLGIAGPITYKKAEELRTLVYNLPIDRLLVETDSPYLSPEPRRGKRNEPANVEWILNTIASNRKQDADTVARITTVNAETLFNWTD
jgi:TatD DNase family protein